MKPFLSKDFYTIVQPNSSDDVKTLINFTTRVKLNCLFLILSILCEKVQKYTKKHLTKKGSQWIHEAISKVDSRVIAAMMQELHLSYHS